MLVDIIYIILYAGLVCFHNFLKQKDTSDFDNIFWVETLQRYFAAF